MSGQDATPRAAGGMFCLLLAVVSAIAWSSPVSGRPEQQEPTPPFPTLPPTEPFPTLPPDIPTPAPFTPTPTPPVSRTPMATRTPTVTVTLPKHTASPTATPRPPLALPYLLQFGGDEPDVLNGSSASPKADTTRGPAPGSAGVPPARPGPIDRRSRPGPDVRGEVLRRDRHPPEVPRP